MKKSKLSYASMNRSERIFGCIWLVVQLFLPWLMGLLNGLLSDPMSDGLLAFVTYCVNFVAVCSIFHHFLRDSLRAAWQKLWNLVQAVVLGIVFYWACDWAVNWLLSYLIPGYTGLVDASIAALSGSGLYLRLIGVILLSPVIEESLYRGLVFRGLWQKHKVLAYILSMVVFSAVHVLGYIGSQDATALVLCFLRYLPAGLILAWTYTKADNICAPILVHAVINAVAIGILG